MTTYNKLIECIHLEVVGINKRFSWRRALWRIRTNQRKRFLFWW